MPDIPLVTLVAPGGEKIQGPRTWAEGPFKREGYRLAPTQREADAVAQLQAEADQARAEAVAAGETGVLAEPKAVKPAAKTTTSKEA